MRVEGVSDIAAENDEVGIVAVDRLRHAAIDLARFEYISADNKRDGPIQFFGHSAKTIDRRIGTNPKFIFRSWEPISINRRDEPAPG